MRALGKIKLLQEFARVAPGCVKSDKKIMGYDGRRRNIVSIPGIWLKDGSHQPSKLAVPADFCIQIADHGQSMQSVFSLSS